MSSIRTDRDLVAEFRLRLFGKDSSASGPGREPTEVTYGRYSASLSHCQGVISGPGFTARYNSTGNLDFVTGGRRDVEEALEQHL